VLTRASAGQRDVVMLGILALAGSWMMTSPLDGSLRDVLSLGFLLLIFAGSGSATLRLTMPHGEAGGLLVLGPGLLVGSMVFAATELVRVSLGLASSWWTLAPVSTLAMYGLYRHHRASLDDPRPVTATVDIVVVAGVACLGLGYGRAPVFAAGLVLVVAAVASEYTASVQVRSLQLAAGVLAAGLLLAMFAREADGLGTVEAAEGLHENLALGVSDVSGTDRLLDRHLRYHWLGHLVAGAATRAFDLSPFVTTGALVPVLSMLGASATVIAAGTRDRMIVRRRAWGAALIVVAGASPFEQLIFGTDTQSANLLSTAWLVVVTYLAVRVAQTGTASWPAVGLIGGTSLVLAGAKFSHAILLGLVLVALASTRREDRRFRDILGASLLGTLTAYALLIRGGRAGEMVQRIATREALSFVMPSGRVATALPIGAVLALAALLLVTHFVVRTPHLAWGLSTRQRRRTTTAVLVAGLVGSLPTLLLAWGEERNLYWLGGAITCVGVALASMDPSGAETRDSLTPSALCISVAAGLGVLVPLAMRLRYELRDAPSVISWWNTLTICIFAWPIAASILTIVVARNWSGWRPPRSALTAAVVACTASSVGLYGFLAAGERIVRRTDLAAIQWSPSEQPAQPSELFTAGTWIAGSDRVQSSLIATNAICDEDACDPHTYTLGAVSRHPILWEGAIASYLHFDPARLIEESGRKRQLSRDFARTASSNTAAALRTLGVRWYVLREGPGTAPRADACATDHPWRCVLLLDRVVVIDLEERT
jgi:hypothetical protein